MALQTTDQSQNIFSEKLYVQGIVLIYYVYTYSTSTYS